MSVKIPSPGSLEAAVAHALGIKPKLGAPGKQHNVGGCGGGGCSCGKPSGGFAMLNSFPAGLVGSGPNTMTATDAYTAMMASSGYPVQPYADENDDMLCMTPVSSGAPQAVAIGASAVITISPTRGWLDMFYLKLAVLNPATGLEVDTASYRITPPRVADCPQPCDATAMRGSFYRGPGDACCGCRWRAIVGRTADGEQMTFTFTNDGVAAVSVQAVARGYCRARNLCI